MRKRIQKKLHSKAGMSILETLSSLMILLLLTAGMTTTVKLAMEHYQKSMRLSEGKVLCSTLVTVISNELSYTTDIRMDDHGNVMEFLSQTYGMQSSLSSFMTDAEDHEDYGKILLGNKDDISQAKNLMGRSAYPNGLTARVDTIRYDNDTCCFTLHLSIGFQGNEVTGQDFQILNVNRTVAKIE